MARLLGIDYGEKRIGLALTDEDQMMAFEFEIWSPRQFWDGVSDLVAEKEIAGIVLGRPLNMSGGETKKTQEVDIFKAKLEDLVQVPIQFVDERLTSKWAASLSGADKNIDALAAQLILQHYIDKRKKEI